MSPDLLNLILTKTCADSITEVELVQELWSGFGQLNRVYLSGSELNSVIVKDIDLSSKIKHPRGWNSSASYNRKLESYKIEQSWYENYANRCGKKCKVPKLIFTELTKLNRVLILQDLNASGFSERKTNPSLSEVKLCLNWLANFHAAFLGVKPDGLWDVGTYWHLVTRKEELEKMEDSPLKEAAHQIDDLLNNCNHKTLVHGDAKVANFCFHENGNEVAAVDFQYVGGGCGMKDVAYLLSSCLNENQLFSLENELLDYYFESLEDGLKNAHSTTQFSELEIEWRSLYPVCWADFSRFLLGWMPTHAKLNGYSEKMVDYTLSYLR